MNFNNAIVHHNCISCKQKYQSWYNFIINKNPSLLNNIVFLQIKVDSTRLVSQDRNVKPLVTFQHDQFQYGFFHSTQVNKIVYEQANYLQQGVIILSNQNVQGSSTTLVKKKFSFKSHFKWDCV